MDRETGEDYRDRETGELPAVPTLNSETGEEEICCTQPEMRACPRRTFKIPDTYIKKSTNESVPKILTGKMSPVILFLLPTVFCLPIIAVILGVIESVLHTWAHKKNKTLKNADVYYQSPLHVIASEFCKACIEKNTKNKITKIQDRNTTRFTKYSIEYVRRIVT